MFHLLTNLHILRYDGLLVTVLKGRMVVRMCRRTERIQVLDDLMEERIHEEMKRWR